MNKYPHTHTLEYAITHLPAKRIFDLLFSLGALIVCSPLFLIIFFLIYFSSPGPAIYAHTRVGRGGKTFKCYKFRSMYLDADERLQELITSDPALSKEWKETRKLKCDPRIIPIGNFLRKTSLDELPQFWNVLKGDLSIVGPRPVVYEEIIEYFGPKAEKILSIRPGLTGIWQVSGRSDISYTRRIQLDEEYVDKRSLLLDIKLICKTIPSILASRGAY